MDQWEEIELPADGSPIWAGMSNYIIFSPRRLHRLDLAYVGEPPHGDSYHSLHIDGKHFPGYAWGCLFAASSDSRYIAFSWMEEPYQRKTVVVDLDNARYLVLPVYLYNLTLNWPELREISKNTIYTVTGREKWMLY